MAHQFTTLRSAVEKLLEAEYFLAHLAQVSGPAFQFELNAFLSASRSVTFVLQKVMSEVPGFATWYAQKQAVMRTDTAMRFFIELRNISQKQGPVSFVGGSLPGGGWTYRFVGQPNALPEELSGRDIGSCCAVHIAKLATLLLECADAFPFQTCPRRAFTEDGMAELRYTWRDVETAIGLPREYTDVGGIPASEKLRILSREIEPLDLASIQRIAAGQIFAGKQVLKFPETSGLDLVDDIATMMADNNSGAGSSRNLFLDAIMRRIKSIEEET
ncbi:hypothetical protein G6L97_13720 [Agrobacterium tumefaciens]|uniref:hypothetical protein n=1 Tax=Agrobacterium tumefaciens TaxID=358 RepID=UPI001571C8B9|nr:hypothetical protein [Agrobacterium tumefaciens]NSZ85224.1 hypothetical protein [Agrobacterium tumefaciens]WCA70475.1 hypothetical protein G6L97_13720 [Agrobacterium tumefaciens]